MEEERNSKGIELDDTEVEEESPLRVEDVFKRLGGFSYYQIFATITIVSLEVPSAMITFSPVLIGTTQVSFYCDYGDGSNWTLTQEELCNNSCSGTIKSDEPYVSIVQEWGLYCDRAWIIETLESLQMFGCIMGPVITAHVADHYGRKPAFYMVCLVMGISGIASSLSDTLLTYGASRFISGFAAGGCLVAHMNYLMEYLTPSWRVICGCVTLWPLGQIMLGLFGYLLQSWRTLIGVNCIPPLLLLFTIPFLHESPRWLLCKNRTKEAAAVLNSIARWNRKPELTPEVIEKLQLSVLAEDKTAREENRGSTRNKFLAILKDKVLVRHILILALVWFSNDLTYMGISFNMKNMSGNRYLNVALMGFFDFPAEWSGIYFSNRFGRKVTFMTTLAGAAIIVAIVAIIQLTSDGESGKYGSVILILCLFGRFFNESSYAVMACLTGEVFPTVVRSLCFSICSTFASIGAVVSPWMVMLGKAWAPGPYVVFFALSTFSCAFSLGLKEMKGKPLEDTSATKKGLERRDSRRRSSNVSS